MPCVPAVSRRALPGALSVLALGGLLVEAGGTAWAAPASEPNGGEAATQSAPLLLAQAMPQLSTSVALGQTGAPVVSILQPGYADLLKGRASILIGVNAIHDGAQTVEMFLDGLTATAGPVALAPAPTTEFKFDTTLFKDGPHRLKVKVTDALGFIGQSEVTIYINNGRKVDVTAPVLRWLNVQSGDMLRGDARFRLQATDNFGIKYVFVKVTPAADPGGQAVRILFANRPPYIFDFDTTLVPDGVYLLSATSKDAMDNEGRAPTTYIGIVNRTINPTIIMGELDSATKSSPEAASTIQKPNTSGAESHRKVLEPLTAPSNAASPGVPTGGSGNRTAETEASHGKSAPSAPLAAPPDNAMTTIEHNEQPAKPSASGSYSRIPGRDNTTSDAPWRIGTLPMPFRRLPRAPQPAPTVAAPGMSTHAAATAPADAMTTMPAGSPDATRAGLTHSVPQHEQQGAWLDTSPHATKRGQKSQPAKSTPTKSGVKAATSATRSQPFQPEIRPADPASFVMRGETTRPARANNGNAQANASMPVATTTSGSQTLTNVRVPSLPSRAGVQAPIEHSNVMRSSGLAVAPRNTGTSPTETTTTQASGTRAPVPTGTLTPMPIDNDALIASTSGMQKGAPGDSLLLPSIPGASVGRIAPNAASSSSQPFVAPRITAPLVAALPPSTSTRRHGAAAITVVPMSSDNAMPALHVVAQGETLSSIAARFHVPHAVLAASNNLKPTARVLTGTTLRMPRPLEVSFGGKKVTGDVAALMVGSTSVTPFRFLFEQQGGSLAWDATRQQVVARNATQEITLTIGSRAAVVDRQKVMMDLAAFLLSGRTMVPVRFFEKALHAQVDWEPVSGRLYISMAPVSK